MMPGDQDISEFPHDDHGGVWQNANDVHCKTTEEFSYWITLFRKVGKPEQALILEAQHLALHS